MQNDPKNIKYLKKLGAYLRKLSRFEQSIEVFQTLIKRGKIDVEVYYNLAFNYVLLSDYDNAKEMFKNINSSSAGADILRDCYLKLIMVKFTSKYTADPVLSYPNTMPPLVINTFDYIDKHITEEITLKELENAIHHNGTYISRCVKKISGLTIQQYIIAKRIALACKLLKEGCSASEACFRSGFNNYSNFSRTFTKQAGKSPKQLQMEWRKNLTE